MSKKIRKSVYYSAITHFFSVLISLATIVILARLLTPDEFGVYAIANSLIFIATALQNLGTINYLVREETVTEELQRSCYSITLGISSLFGILIILLSGYVAEFFKINSLKELLLIFSISFFISPYTLVPRAMLIREFKFKEIMIILLSNQIVSFCMTMYLVLNGFSYFSMAYGQLSGLTIALLLNNYYAKNSTPIMLGFKDAKKILSAGTQLSISNLLEQFSNRLSDLVLGKIGSTYEVAIFSRGTGFIDFLKKLITNGAQPIVQPFLSKINRDNANISDAYIKSINLIGSLLWPILGVALVSGEPAIMLFFGDQWNDSSKLVIGVGLWFLFKSVHIFSPAYFTTQKSESYRLVKELMVFIITISSIYFLYPFGLKAISWGLAVIGILDMLLTTFFLVKFLGLDFQNFIKSIYKNIYLTLICTLLIYLFRYFMNFDNNQYLIETYWITFISIATWLFGIKLFKLPIYDELVIILTSIKRKFSG